MLKTDCRRPNLKDRVAPERNTRVLGKHVWVERIDSVSFRFSGDRSKSPPEQVGWVVINSLGYKMHSLPCSCIKLAHEANKTS